MKRERAYWKKKYLDISTVKSKINRQEKSTIGGAFLGVVLLFVAIWVVCTLGSFRNFLWAGWFFVPAIGLLGFEKRADAYYPQKDSCAWYTHWEFAWKRERNVVMKKLLIVVDMQKDFVDGALGTGEAVAIVPRVVEKIENFYGDILVTYDTHPDTYMNTREGRYLPVPHCIKGTPGWQLDAKVQTALDKREYHAIEKPTFGSVSLPEYIRANYDPQEIEIELIGLCTDICVVSNALLLKANFPETEIRVDAACCAGVTVESHNAALLTMKMCQIQVLGER